MAISDTDVKAIYQGDGATTTFAINFDYTDTSEVKAILRDESVATPTETTWTNPTNFSISGANIIAVVAPASTAKLLVYRSNPLTQSLNLVGSEQLNVEGLEEELDKLQRQIQELAEELTRVPKLPKTYPTTLISDLTFPEPVASTVLGWNSSKTGLVNSSVTSSSSAALVTTKGDLMTFDTGAVRLAVGSNGQVLTADSTQSKGIKWSSVSALISAPINILGWKAEAGGPQKIEENNLWVWKFDDGIQQKIATLWRVPESYTAGQQIFMKAATYAPSTSLTTLLKSTATLLQNNGTTAITSTTNQRASTNTAITAASPSSAIRQQSLDLTSSTGTINSVAVAIGDWILIELERDFANDTDTNAMRLVDSSMEAVFV